MAIGTPFRFGLVCVVALGDQTKLPFFKGLETKRASEVVDRIGDIFAELRAMFGPDVKITRFHSDRGTEFVNKDMARMLREKTYLADNE